MAPGLLPDEEMILEYYAAMNEAALPADIELAPQYIVKLKKGKPQPCM